MSSRAHTSETFVGPPPAATARAKYSTAMMIIPDIVEAGRTRAS